MRHFKVIVWRTIFICLEEYYLILQFSTVLLQHFLRTGTCKYGFTCKYNHPKSGLDEGNITFNIYGLPIRQVTFYILYFLLNIFPFALLISNYIPLVSPNLCYLQGERSCSYYMRTGYCKFGFACKFNHPQPSATPGTAFPFPASIGPSITSPSGHPLMGGISPWLPRHYMSNPQTNGFPSYLPYVFPSSHGIIPTQHGWNSYTVRYFCFNGR